MKKQFLLLIVIIFTGVCFSSLNNNGLKACDANMTACSAMKKCGEEKMPSDYTTDDAPVNMFMNPFIH